MTFPFTSTRFVTIFLFSMSFLTHTVLPYMFTGFQIRDLEGTGTNFISDAASWHTTVQSAANIYTTDCGVYLLGGWNVLGAAGVSSGNQYFYRTYTNLPAHTMIRYSFTFYALDTWDISTNDGFRLAFDTGVVDGWHLDYTTFQPNLCGGSNAKDLANVRVFGTVTHSATSLTFKIISAFDEPPNNESFGFRDLILLFSQGPVTTETQCARQAAGITVPKQCTCAEGSYYSTSCVTCNGNCASCFGSGTGNCFACKTGGYGWDGFNCIVCNSYCYDCYGSAATQCNSCKSGYAYYAETTTCLEDCQFPLTKNAATGGTYLCTSPCAAGSFVYWDKSCSTTCAAPLVQKTLTIGTVKLCTYPCTSNEYLYWDGSCKPNCGFPLQTTIISGMKLCTYKCTAAQYLDWNNVCVTICNYPLVRRVVIDKNICTSPCYRSTDFIYWNQECSSACIAPLKQRTASGLQYCDYPCLLNSQYLYWNGSCIDSCSSPLKVRFERGKQFCDYPGDTANYLYWDGTDSPTCPSPPLIQKTEGTSPVLKFCLYGCNDWEFLYWNGACATTCKFPLQKRIQNGKQFCDYGTCTGTDALFWDGSCRDVSTCTAPLIPKTEGGKQFCNFPAGNTSNFLYWDGTFSAVCPEPLTQRIDGTTIIRKFCDYKCTNPLEYLAFNDQCLSTCDAPHIARTQNGKLFCNFACGTQYLFHNGTCRDSCPSPYVERIDGLGKYCDHPCTTVTDSYYWNGVCGSTCPSPLNQITVETTKWCIYPCSANQFLAPNGACLDACDFPFTKTKVSDMKYCSSSCSTNEYLYWGDGTCISSCESPLRKSVTDIGNICKSPCDSQEEYYDESTGICLKTCGTISVSVNGLYLLCQMDRSDTSSFLDIILEAPSNSTLSLVVLTKLTTHIRYLDMDMPPKVQKLAVGKGRSILSLRFGSSMSGEMQESFQKYEIPAIFLNQGTHSNFIVNFWEEMTSWCIVVVTIAVFLFIEVICKARDWREGQEVCEKIVTILKWNVMIILIATSLGDILLYTSFELRTLYASSSFTSISREICLGMVSIGITLIIGTYLLSVRYKNIKEVGPPHKVSEYLETWKGYQTVYNGYKHPLFYLVYLIRIILCGIITAFLFFTPFFQTLFHMLISVIMVSYIAYSRPIASKLNYIQLLITEILILIINVSLFALAILLRSSRQNSSLGIMFGDLVVGCDSCINILFIVVLAIKIIDAIRTVCVYQGAQRKHDSSAWIQILAVIPSQCGFGFEEISVNTLNKPIIQAREKPRQQQTLVTETSQLMGSKSPEPDEPGMSIQLTSQVDRETLNTWEGNREKEMKVDSVFDKGIKEDRGEEKDIMTTSRFGSDTKRTKGVPPLDLKLWERMERGIREGYEDQEE